jgi:hypothetical protein
LWQTSASLTAIPDADYPRTSTTAGYFAVIWVTMEGMGHGRDR